MVLAPTKKRIARTFGLKAPTYDANALFQANIIRRLLPFIDSVATKNGRWIDLGCGTGLLLKHNSRETGSAVLKHYFGLDIAFEPLRVLKKKDASRVCGIQGDIDHLPIKPSMFEGAVASSVLQWLADPSVSFTRIAAIIRQGGYCVFSLFINGSFFELFKIRSSFGLPLPVHCPGPDYVNKAVAKAGFDLIHSETVEEKHYFPDAITLLKKISGMGGAVTGGNTLTRRELDGFCRRYDATFLESKGVPLTHRAMLGICRKRAF